MLDSPNGSVKRDTWTSGFADILFALDFPKLVDKPPVVIQPDRLPGTVVQIPDPNLRAAIAEALDKGPNVPITVQEMEGLGKLEAGNRDIQDLTGLQFATNLNELSLNNNQVSDLSPIAGLINLRELRFSGNPVSDFSPLKDLQNLTRMWFNRTPVSDLSPLAGLINLKGLEFWETNVSDLSPLAELVNLEFVGFSSVSDLSPLAELINLRRYIFTGLPYPIFRPLQD